MNQSHLAVGTKWYLRFDESCEEVKKALIDAFPCCSPVQCLSGANVGILTYPLLEERWSIPNDL